MRPLLALLLIVWSGTVVAQESKPPAGDDQNGRAFLTLNVGETAGHIGVIRGLAFSPDGTRLYSVGADKTVQIWDTETHERIKVLRVPVGQDQVGELYSVAVSPDKRTLALRCWRMWDVEQNKHVHGTIELLNLNDGRIRWLDERVPVSWSGIAFSPDGNKLAAGLQVWEGMKGIWNQRPEQIEKKQPLTAADTVVGFHPVFSPDGTQVIAGSMNDTVNVLNLKTKPPTVVALPGHPNDNVFTAAGWDGKGRPITGDPYGNIRVWSADGRKLKEYHVKELGPRIAEAVAKLPMRIVHLAAISEDEVVVSGRVGPKNCTGVLNLKNPSKSREGLVHHHLRFFNEPAAAVSADGKIAACTTGPMQNEVVFWDPATGQAAKRRLRSGARVPLSVTWSKEGQRVCWKTAEGSARELGGPFGFDFKDPHLSRVSDADKDDRRLFHGSVREKNGWKLEVPNGDEFAFQYAVTNKGKEISRTEAAALPISAVTFVGGTEAPAHVVWCDRNRLFVAAAVDCKPIHNMIPGRLHVESLAPSPDGRHFAATTDLGVLNIYSVRFRAPLLSLLPVGDEWLVWTRLGYYAASPGGERLIGWTVNNGYDRMPTFHPASRMRARFYRPDVIERVLEFDGVPRALMAADRARGRTKGAGEVANVGETLPPTVSFTVTVDKGVATVMASAETSADAEPVTALQLQLDGRAAPSGDALRKFDTAKKKGDRVEATWKLKLQPGPQQLTVLARGRETFAVTDPVTATGKQTSKPVEHTLHFVGFGVSNFKNNDTPGNKALNLEFPDKDVKDLHDAVEQHCAKGGLYAKSKTLFTYKQNADANVKTLRETLQKLAGVATHGDLAIVSISCHGGKDDQGNLWLLLHEADRKQMTETCFSGEELKKLLAEVPCNVLLLLDACHAGAIGPSYKTMQGELTMRLIDEDCAVTVITAAMGKEYAFEGKDARGTPLKNGWFTHALIEAMKNSALKDEDGLLFVSTLYDNVRMQMRTISKEKQNPFFAPGWGTRPFAVLKR